jgi:hypothetical protein
MMPDDLKFPMRVGEFLDHAEELLQPGDIVLSRTRTFSSWLIRLATGSPFSHAALVFLLPRRDEQLNSAFLLESVSSGVGLANFKSYVTGRSRSQIAIRRLNRPWADESFRKQVGGIMLDCVHAGYDFSLVLRLGLSALFGTRLGLSRLSRGSSGSMRRAVEKTKRQKHDWIPPQFICAGFVQYGFVEAQRRRDGAAEDVIFRKDAHAGSPDELLAVTPEDIAETDRLDWVFVIRNGWAYRVSSYAEAKKIISSVKL